MPPFPEHSPHSGFYLRQFRRRTLVITFFITLGFAAVMGRVFYLTWLVPEKKVYSHRKKVMRGAILDRNNMELALSKEMYDIGVHPRRVKDPERLAAIVAPILGLAVPETETRLRANRRFFFLKRAVPRREANLVSELKLPAVQKNRLFQRVYPNNRLAGPVLGFTSIDNAGLEGLEKTYESFLSRPADDAALKGHNIHLNLDALIQFRVEQVLEEYRQKSGAERAVGIFMETHTGRVLSLAVLPGYDPNQPRSVPARQRVNLAIRHNYEPGSTMKVFIAAALLSEGLITTREKFHCAGKVKIGDIEVKCLGHHGDVTIGDILKFSCNAGIIQAASRIEPEALYYYLQAFGFGDKTGIDLLGETDGRIPVPKRWTPSKKVYLPIGQGVAVTPIQLITALAAIGSEGELYQPRMVRRLSDSFGDTTRELEPAKVRTVITPHVARFLVQAMARVVAEGTGRGAKLTDMALAGKTGTGQISGPQGYIPDAYTASFMALFPAEKPRFAGLVLFDRPRSPNSGGSLAAPAFGKIVRTILPLLQKQPGKKIPGLKLIRLDPGGLRRDILPDLRGRSYREVLHILKHLGVKGRVKGFGYAVHQSHPPGSPVNKIKNLEVRLAPPGKKPGADQPK